MDDTGRTLDLSLGQTRGSCDRPCHFSAYHLPSARGVQKELGIENRSLRVQERIQMMRGFEDKALVFERVARRVRRCRSQNRENGQTMVEYALLITFIALVALVAIKVLGSSVSSLFDSVASSF